MRKFQRVLRPRQSGNRRERIAAPFPTCTGECDEMPRQVPAIDRRDILRIERSKILRVVPVKKVPADAGKLIHCGKGRFKPFNGFKRSDPSEVASARDRQKIEAYVCG